MSQIALGMDYLHGQGVVHHDLKPNNILVSPNPNPEPCDEGYVQVKLADFGMAKTKVNTSASILHAQICEAPSWRALEAFEDQEGHSRLLFADTLACSRLFKLVWPTCPELVVGIFGS